jgi:hypothetical protein
MDTINKVESGSLKEITKGDTLLTRARIVSGGKIELEFAEKLTVAVNSNTLVNMLNQTDDRFGNRGARRAWGTVMPEEAEAAFNINLGDDAGWEYQTDAKGRQNQILPLNILNPVTNGVRWRVIIEETVTPDKYQADNVATKAKRKGEQGDFMRYKGDYIFTNATVVNINGNTDEEHTFLQADVDITTADTKELAPERAEAEPLNIM